MSLFDNDDYDFFADFNRSSKDFDRSFKRTQRGIFAWFAFVAIVMVATLIFGAVILVLVLQHFGIL